MPLRKAPTQPLRPAVPTRPDLVLRGAALAGREGEGEDRFDLIIQGGRLAGVGLGADGGIGTAAASGTGVRATAGAEAGSGFREYQLEGRLVLPALVDLHHHLDKAYSLPDAGVADDLPSAIAAAGRYPARVGRERLVERGLRLLGQAVSSGVGILRTHVNVGGPYGLRGLEVALELRERVGDRLAVQVVAMASGGVVPGSADWALMEEAARLGCDALGGSVGVRSDPAPLLDGLFALAVQYDLPLDLHVDEHDQPQAPGLREIIPRTIASGYRGRVTASHCCALGVVPEGERRKLIGGLVEAGIAVVVNPLTNLFLQGRGTGDVPGPRGIAPVRALLRAGVQVACASDNVQDPYLPYGNADPLLAALVLGVAGHLTTAAERDALLGMVTDRAARVAGVADYGLSPGRPADLVVLDVQPPDHPVASLPRRWLVVHGGRIQVTAVDQAGRAGESADKDPALKS